MQLKRCWRIWVSVEWRCLFVSYHSILTLLIMSWLFFCLILLCLRLGESDAGFSDTLNLNKRQKQGDGKETDEKSLEDFQKTQAEFDKHVERNVRNLLAEYAMEVEEKSRKRSVDEANAPAEEAESEGWMTADEFAQAQAQSKFYMNEDDGIQIPGVHPFYNLPVDLQLMILDLPGSRLDDVLDYINRHAPKKKPDEFEGL